MRPLAFFTPHLNTAAMHLDGHLDEVEAYAGADNARDVAAAVIALEQPIEVGRGNADARICDGDDGLLPNGRSLDLDRAAARRIFDGIREKIAKNLKQ